MRALTVVPGASGTARLEDVAPLEQHGDRIRVRTHAIGICGTDREIIDGKYGTAPPGAARLILGHESIGRVIAAPSQAGVVTGDWVCGIVRHPDPVPCASCARGEWDMCLNGRYTEHGIKGRDGFAVDEFELDPAFAVRVDPALGELGVLLEPTSIVAKAWDHVTRIGGRAYWQPQRALITGAGPVGLLAALLAVQRGLDVHVLDRVTIGPKPRLVADLGATYHTGAVDALGGFDVILECTGVPRLVLDVMQAARPDGIVCLTGVSSGGRTLPVDAGALNRELVLENIVVFGSVNANRMHYEQGAAALAKADQRWLKRLITRRVALDHWQSALSREENDVKVIVEFQ